MFMTSFISGGGFNYEIQSVGGKWSWKVIVDNITNYGQYYYISDINSPFGPISTVWMNIPSEVIAAMSNSLDVFQQQLRSRLSLISNNSVTVTVSEGDYTTDVSDITVTNSGALGSFLSFSATQNQSWMLINPSSTRGVSKNQQSFVNVRVDPSTLTYGNSPYSCVVNLQDINDPLTIIPVSYIVNVLPRPEISVDTNLAVFSYDVATNSESGPVVVSVLNSGPPSSILNAYISKVNSSQWFDYSPTQIGPLDSGDSTNLTLSLNMSYMKKNPGIYNDTVLVSSNNASNQSLPISVRLIVT